MDKIFSSDFFLFRWLETLCDLLLLNLVWLLCCIPVVTIVPSCAAMYDCVACCILGDEGAMYRRFFATFRREWKRGILLSLLLLAVAALIVLGFLFIGALDAINSAAYLFMSLYPVAVVLSLGMLSWIVAMSGRYTIRANRLFRNAMLLSIGKLPTTVAVVVLLLAGGLAIYVVSPLLLILPAILCTAQCALMERVFRRVFPQPEAEAEE